MPLPKLAVITHECTLPSTGKKITFRSFLVKEEKILMMAMQSEEPNDMVRALKDIITNCVEDDIVIDNIASFDLEYLFLQLRARSVGNMIPITYSLEEDCTNGGKCQFETEINIDDVKVEKKKEHKDLIDLTKDIKIKMKYPEMTSAMMVAGTQGEEMVNRTFDLIGDCIEYIMDGEQMHNLKDYTKEEKDEFLNSLSTGHFKEIQNFFDTMPKLQHQVVAKCKTCQKEDTKVLEGLGDFFG